MTPKMVKTIKHLSVWLGLAFHVIDHTYHYFLLHSIIPPSSPAELNMLIHMREVSCEATLCSFGHFTDHRIWSRGEQEPVHAVEAADNKPQGT